MNGKTYDDEVWFVLSTDGTWAGGFSSLREAEAAKEKFGGHQSAQIVRGRWFDLGDAQ